MAAPKREETDPARFSALRLAHYCLDIADLLQTRRVVPVVIFLRGGPNERRLELGSDETRYLDFHFIAVELTAMPFGAGATVPTSWPASICRTCATSATNASKSSPPPCRT